MNDKNSKYPLLKIRNATIEDVLMISNLIISSINHFHAKSHSDKEIAIWERGYLPTKIEAQILTRQSIVLEIAGEIAGFIQFDCPEIKGFYIKPSFSGQGFGGILLEYLLMDLKKKGHKKVELTSNKLVIEFYKKYGFEFIQEELVYWENHPFLEYRMIKILED